MKGQQNLDVRIGSLSASVQNGAGHEHRMTPIVHRAASVLAERLQKQATNGSDAGLRSLRVESLATTPVNLNLRVTSNEQAARAIASAWFDAIMKVQSH